MDPITVLVISDPAASHLRPLERLPQPVNLLVGDTPDFLAQAAPKADVILSGFSDGAKLQSILPIAQRLRWIHALSAGVEKILTPELIESPVPLTNGRAVFGPALAEFALAAIFYFAKDLRRLVRSQEVGRWDQFDVQWVRGQVLGLVGYGGIGQDAARLARAIGMRVIAVRRRKGLSEHDPVLDRVFAPDQLHEMLGLADYVLVATPLTAETRGLIGEAELAAMKRSAVIINVGRGPLIQELALIWALREKFIKGAALDVFDREPLPSGHAFYGLDNVLLSPHSADHTVGWLELALERFIDLFERFQNGEPLEYVVDKKAGY
jgi:phosphoglycerate dehydrogenase-like enzyme